MERVLYSAHPSMFRSHPILFLLCLATSVYGIGLVVLLIWWFRNLQTKLTVTDRSTVLRRGLFSKRTIEIRNRDVQDIAINQTFFQRIFGVGDVNIDCSGTSHIEIRVWGMPRPYKIRRLIYEVKLTPAGFWASA
jgi:uncharacterized membrane protein YdbT with pleckstrin-like domain